MKRNSILASAILSCLCLVGIIALFKNIETTKEEIAIVEKESTVNDESEEIIKEENVIENEEFVKEEEINYVSMDVNDVYIPILMYHSISNADPDNRLLVPVEQFSEQIKWLSESGFTPMLMGDVLKAFETGQVPEKPVAITFDDGYVDNYTDAYRILKENNMTGTFFVITDNTDKSGDYLNSEMLKEMLNDGMAIENHTSNHLELDSLSVEDKLLSIKTAKDFIMDNLGVESKYLCYPVGKYDEETIEAAKSIGIEAAVTTEGGFSNINNGLFELKRVRIAPIDLESFKYIFVDFMTE
ncbi:polysaccharide deacetylase family protein [Clostridium sp.]|uniref:polysaccharide deacetylase family protein n=1 Tax=Clostridium sp. TaxID=1506 RepID=UPI003F38DBFE